MVGCCGRLRLRYIKHARLVNNCYPKKEGQLGPLSAELSYLTFYASSRPAKLTKVGSYLQKKVNNDIRKGRKENNKVSLRILKALIQTCHRDINLFCRSVVVILIQLLDTRDMVLIDLACDTFYVFCSYYDSASLGVDPEFTRDYEKLVSRFASFAIYPNDDASLALQMKYCGHRAIAAIVNSSAIHSSDTVVLFGIIIPPLLATLDTSSSFALELSKSVPSIDVRCSVFEVENLSMEWIQHLAAQTLSLLFSLSNGIGVRTSLTPCKDYYTSQQRWWPTKFCESVSELILHSIQPQYRYLMLTNVLYYLHRPVDMTDLSQVDRFVGNVAILRTILTSKLQLMGVPVLELLTSLYTLMMKSLTRTGTFYDKKPDSQHPEQLKHYSVQHDLFESIVGLASQSYYANQWNDIIGYIIDKLRTKPSSSQIDNTDTVVDSEQEKTIIRDVPTHLYQQCSVRFLYIFQANAIKALENETMDPDVTFTMETWLPGLEILYDDYQDIRLKFADTLIHFLSSTPGKNSDCLSSLYNSFGNSSFLHQLLKSIYVWVRLKNVDVRDMMAIYQLLCCIPRRFNGYGVIRTVPFIFALQDLAYDCIHASTGVADRTHHNIVSAGDDFVQKKSVGADDSCSIQEFTTATNTPVIGDSTIQDTMPGGVITDDLTIPVSGATPSCIAPSSPSLDGPSIDNPIDYRSIKYQQSLATVTLEWIRTMAEITGMEQVMNYAQSIKEKRQHLHQEPKLDLTTKPTADAPCLDDAQFGINKVIDWMDRQKVVKAILDDDKLHDQQISDVNLEERLYVQWASESYENQEKGFRIEVDSDTDMKPKLTAAINNGSLQKRHSQGEKPIVNVENLKGALAAQLLGNEQQQQIIHPPSTDVKIELNQLLSGLYSTMSTKEQSISLVNPPY